MKARGAIHDIGVKEAESESRQRGKREVNRRGDRELRPCIKRSAFKRTMRVWERELTWDLTATTPWWSDTRTSVRARFWGSDSGSRNANGDG